MNDQVNTDRALRHTELRGLTCDDLRLPFSAVLLLVPEEADLAIPMPDGTMAHVSEVYIVEEPEPERVWRLLAIASSSKGEVRQFFSLEMPNDCSIEHSITNTHTQISAQPSALMLNGTGINPASTLLSDGSKLAAKWESLFRWTMNAIAYATSNEERIEIWQNREAHQLHERIKKLPPGKKKERLRDRLRSLDPQRRIVLGPNAKRLDPPPRDGERHVVVRTLVQGHWKQQPVGAARANRKLIFVKPYWRGPTDGPAAVGGVRQLQ